MNAIEKGRAALVQWRASKPTNYYQSNEVLQDLVSRYASNTDIEGLASRLDAYGQVMATTAQPLVQRCNSIGHTPQLARFNGIGERVEDIVFDPSYHELGHLIYGSGVMAITGQPDRALEQAALVLLTSHHGEGGHVCPLACTAGMILVLQQHGHPWLQDRYLPGLTDPGRDRLHGSQFLTEVQGGSDVGANACRAVPVRDADETHPGVYRIYGEKWFCSVADAPLYLVTARPQDADAGTRGLGLFIVPRVLQADDLIDEQGPLPRSNDLNLRRLKDKLGTRGMASAEIDWNGALAYQVGDLQKGFINVVDVVLNMSRIFNALACSGSMYRAFIEASTFARHRTAFGQPIERFALVERSLASLYAEAVAAMASTFDLVHLGQVTRHERAGRIGRNMNKYWTSVRNTQMVRLAMEVLGGNGTIEDFSPLPRLYRDAMVTESWEGAHNVLVAQTRRDMRRYALHRDFLAMLRERLDACSGHLVEPLKMRLERQGEVADAIAADEDEGRNVELRGWIDQVMVTYQAVCLLELSGWQQQSDRAPLRTEVVEHLLRLHPESSMQRDAVWWPRL